MLIIIVPPFLLFLEPQHKKARLRSSSMYHISTDLKFFFCFFSPLFPVPSINPRRPHDRKKGVSPSLPVWAAPDPTVVFSLPPRRSRNGKCCPCRSSHLRPSFSKLKRSHCLPPSFSELFPDLCSPLSSNENKG